MPEVHPLILGTRWDREELRGRIGARLRERLDGGLVEEVEGLRTQGIPSAKLHALGLEYRFVNEFLEGRISGRNDLEQKLASAIAQFAKRQQTWFRRMERQGHAIHWIDRAALAEAMRVMAQHVPAELNS
jgi:tRNA dimethylallyltransferase